MLTTTSQFMILADIADWARLIVIGVFIVIWLFNHFLGGKANAKPPQRQQPAMRPQAGAAKPPPDQPQPLAGEIEEFLKRANQKRQDRTRKKPPVKVAAKPIITSVPARRLVQTSTDKQDFEISVSNSVSEHVQKHLDTHEFSDRAEHLVDDIKKGDVDRATHLKQVFDHKLGRLADTSNTRSDQQIKLDTASQVATDAATIAAATPIASMLANPESLRQAIILNELLTRPEHRW